MRYTLDSSTRFVIVTAAADAGIMVPRQQYLFSPSKDCYARVHVPADAATNASAGNNSHFVAAGASRLFAAIGTRTALSVIRAVEDGEGTLSLLITVP
jgi:hypothetical protein